jgi:outer membrane protein TolC
MKFKFSKLTIALFLLLLAVLSFFVSATICQNAPRIWKESPKDTGVGTEAVTPVVNTEQLVEANDVKAVQEIQKPRPAGDQGKLVQSLTAAGKLYFAKGDYTAAIQKWQSALSVNPDNPTVKDYMEEARYRLRHSLYSPRDIAQGISLSKDSLSVLGLKDCIDIASKNYIPLQVAVKSIKLGEMRLFEARRNLLPTFGLTYEEYSGRVNGREYIGRKQYFELQQPVVHGGELFFTMKQAEINLEVSKNDYTRIKNELILQVKKAYYSLLRSHENVKLQAALSAEVRKIYEIVEKAYKENLIAKVEWLNVVSQEGQVKYQLISAEGDESVAELILKQTMYVDYKDRIDVMPVGQFKKLELDFDRTLTAAYMNRPEMKINALMLQYYKYEVNIMKAKGWPKIDLMGNWGLAKEEYVSQDRLGPNSSGVFDMDQKLAPQYYAGIKFSMPIWGSTTSYNWTKEKFVPVVSSYQGTEAVTNTVKFNFLDDLKYYSNKQNALIDFDRARQEMVKIKQDVTLEVREDCFNYEKAVVQLDTAANKVKYQDKELEITKLRRELDELPDSAVIESLIKTAQEKFGYVSSVAECYTAVASLNKAVGIDNFFDVDGENAVIDKK